MNDPFSEVLGYILVACALMLGLRERHVYHHRSADSWLVTRRRYRRRTFVSFVLAGVGALIAAYGRGAFEARDAITGALDPIPPTIFVFAVSFLCLLLVVLSVLDFSDTARNAARHALEEFALPADKVNPPPAEDSTDSRSSPS